MEKLRQENSVLYSYPTPPLMEDIVNLVLTYDRIYDYEEMLEPLRTQAKAMAQHFSGDRLTFEDVKEWYFQDTFIMIFSISAYYGFDVRRVLDNRFWERILWLQKAKSTRRSDCERFIKIIDSSFQLVLKNAPTVAEKVIKTLADFPKLFDKGIIVPRENLRPDLNKAAKATAEILMEAIEIDEKDDRFVALASEIGAGEDIWWVSAYINGGLLESSYLGIPLHLWHVYLPLIQYKYQRGARYLPKFREIEVTKEAFSVLIPQVYALDISDLLEVRNSSEFSSFRREVSDIYRGTLEAPQDFPNASSLSEYLKSNYFSKLEKLALERRPKPGTLLLKKLISEVHPIIGLIIGGKEVYDEYRHKYKDWRFAVSTLEMKMKLQNLETQRQVGK